MRIAFPIVLANATLPILGIVDTGVVGQLGLAAPIGAVGLGAIILTATYGILNFLYMGTVGLTSQAVGAGDQDEVSALLSRAVMLGLGIGLIIVLAQPLLFWGALQVSPGTPEVEALAREYMGIRVFSAPAPIALYGISGWLVARERTGKLLVLQLWMNGLNIVLDIVFVMHFEWGVAGVAWATFFAEWSGLALGLYLCRDVFQNPAWRDLRRVFDRVILRRMASVNFNLFIRSVLLQAIFVSFLFIGAGFGDVKLAATQILLQFLSVTAYSMDGFAAAAETLVGQAMGARNRTALRRAVLMTGLWAFVIVSILALVFAVFGARIGELMTTSEEVRAAFRVFLPYMVAAPLVGCASWMFDGIFVGATRSKDMRNMMVISAQIYAVSVVILVPWLGNHGLWLALLISFAARGLTLGARYPALERSVG